MARYTHVESLISTLHPQDAAIIKSCFTTTPNDQQYAKPLRVWHVNHLPSNGEITDTHVSVTIGNCLATTEEKKAIVLEMESDRRQLNTWALQVIKNMFVQLARKLNIRLNGNEVCSYKTVKLAMAQTFVNDLNSTVCEELQIVWWQDNSAWVDILEEEYMRVNNIVYRPMTREESIKIRRKCIGKHIRKKFTDLSSELKNICKKQADGKYIVSTLRRSKGIKPPTENACKQKTYLACKQISNGDREDSNEFVCGGNCQFTKDLREKLAVEVQNKEDLESKIIVSLRTFVFVTY
jgi:hypothetical protein